MVLHIQIQIPQYCCCSRQHQLQRGFRSPGQDKSPDRSSIGAIRRGTEKGRGLWGPPPSSFVCLEHFPQADFKDTFNRYPETFFSVLSLLSWRSMYRPMYRLSQHSGFIVWWVYIMAWNDCLWKFGSIIKNDVGPTSIFILVSSWYWSVTWSVTYPQRRR